MRQKSPKKGTYMKKLLLLSSLVCFIFCLPFKNMKADAIPILSYDIFCEDYNLQNEDFMQFDAGFYIIASLDDYIVQNVFYGDLEAYAFDQNLSSLTAEKIVNLFVNSQKDKEQYKNIFQNLLLEFQKFPYSFSYGGYVIAVYSQAVLYSHEPIYELYGTCAKSKLDQSEANIAGKGTHVVNISSPTSLETIQKKYSATDNADGTIDTLSFISNYSLNNLKLGTYFILVTAIDSSKNKICAVDKILVEDFDAPIIVLSRSEIIIEVNTPYSLTSAEEYFSVTDNCTIDSKITKTWHYPKNFSTSQLGEYRLGLTAIDERNNTSAKKELVIQVIDSIAPTIKIKNNMDRIISDKELTKAEILSYLEVEDNYDTSLTTDDIEILENTCTGQAGKIYNIQVKLQDSSGNCTILDIPYDYRDTKAPIIFVVDVLYLDSTKNYTPSEILAMLKEAGIELK